MDCMLSGEWVRCFVLGFVYGHGGMFVIGEVCWYIVGFGVILWLFALFVIFCWRSFVGFVFMLFIIFVFVFWCTVWGGLVDGGEGSMGVLICIGGVLCCMNCLFKGVWG